MNEKRINKIVKESIDNVIKEEKRLNEFVETYYGFKKLNETSINRILEHRKEGFVILSASRREGDYGEPFYVSTEEEKIQAIAKKIKEKNNELKNDIIKKGFAFTPTLGGYKEEGQDVFELSFIVYSRDKQGNEIPFINLYRFALEECEKFNQDCVYIQEPCEKGELVPPYYADRDGNKVNKSSSNKVKINREEEPYFTTIKRDKNAKQRFSSDIVFENKFVPSKCGMIKKMMMESEGVIFV